MSWSFRSLVTEKARFLCVFFLTVSGCVLCPTGSRADLLNTNGADTAPNFAEVRVLDDRVRVHLEIDFPDYAGFVPGGADALPSGREPDPSSISELVGAAFAIRDADGVAIDPEISVVEVRDRQPRLAAQGAVRARSAPAPPERGSRVIYAELDYPFAGKPENLTLMPPLNAAGRPSVNLGFIAYHGEVPVTDYRYLSQAETMRLDWEDPWYTVFDNPNLTRHHRSAVMSFLTVDPREVRLEIIYRLRDLGEWGDVDFLSSGRLDLAQAEAVVRGAELYFETLPPLLIDGKAVEPSSVRAMFLEVGATGVTPIENLEEIDPATALMGAILSYPHRLLPQKIEMTWELFTNAAQRIPVTVADPAGPVPDWATPDSPKVNWTNFLKTWENPKVAPVRSSDDRESVAPLVSAVLFGAALALALMAMRWPARRWPAGIAAALLFMAATTVLGIWMTWSVALDGKAATPIAQAILENVAAAMLETEDEAFQAAIEPFVPEDEAAAVGAEMRRGLSVTLPTGARALTDTIESVEVERIEQRPGGIDLLARWTAAMSGAHWGHMHQRRVGYRGLLDLEETDGVWKLRGLTILSSDLKN